MFFKKLYLLFLKLQTSQVLGTSYAIAKLAPVGEIIFPGTDPSKAPKGYEWRGKPGSKPGSKDGNWYNPETGESLRPDLNHPEPIEPHWDYRPNKNPHWRKFNEV